jgi:hypothetical protein
LVKSLSSVRMVPIKAKSKRDKWAVPTTVK